MARLFGYMGNFADRLRLALWQEREVLAVAESSRPDGWGIGFFQGGEVLHKKRPNAGTAHPVDWLSVTENLRSDCVVGHVRHATVGDLRADNTQPFRFRQWLFAHQGTISRYEAVKQPLVSGLPDFLRRDVRGDTDSEALFHALLSFLHDDGRLDHPDITVEPVIAAMRTTVSLVDRLVAEVGGKPSTMNIILTNGRVMVALRRGAPLAYTERRGIMDLPANAPHELRNADLGAVRYVLVVGGVSPTATGYTEVKEGHLVSVGRSLEVQSHVP